MRKLLFIGLLFISAGLLFVSIQASAHSPRDLENVHNVAPRLDPELHAPSEVSGMIDRSCADCHSQSTHWPWYAQLPLVGSAMRSDVERARSVVNFSKFPHRAGHSSVENYILTTACADLRSHRMPLSSYLLVHPGSRPSDVEIQAFCLWSQQRIAQQQQQKTDSK